MISITLTPQQLEELMTRVFNELSKKLNLNPTKPTDYPEIVGMEDASKFLHIQPSTIRKYVAKGLLKRAMPNIKGYRFFQAELTRFANNYRP